MRGFAFSVRRACVPEGELRAYLDGELAPATRVRAEQHLARCNRCHAQMENLKRTAVLVHAHLDPLHPQQQADAQRALARARASLRQPEVTSNIWRSTMSGKSRVRAWRPVLAGVVVLALLVGVFSFAPSQALARQFLSVFRMRRFAVVQVNPDQARVEEVGRALEKSLFAGEPEEIVSEPARSVSTVEEAQQIAGFQVRVPTIEGTRPITSITVVGRTEIAHKVSREGLAMLLELAGMDSRAIPTGFTEGRVRAAAAAVVNLRAGRFELTQVRSPIIEYPDGIDPRLVGQAGLQILGLSPADARRISERLNWSNTLLVPVPTTLFEVRELTVAGEEAALLIPRDPHERQKGAALLWQKDDVVYCLVSPASAERIVQAAESMF